MKKFLIAVFLVVLALGLGGVWFYQNTRPVETTRTDKSFLIVKGTSASQIGANLEKAGLIRSALVFKLYLKFTGAPKKILAGDYNLSPGFSLFELLRQLLKGPKEIWVTIPEGLRREEVARKFAVALGKDETFVQDFLKLTQNKEGFLFPETYLFPKEAEAGKIIRRCCPPLTLK